MTGCMQENRTISQLGKRTLRQMKKKKKKKSTEVHIQSWYLRVRQVRAVCQCLGSGRKWTLGIWENRLGFWEVDGRRMSGVYRAFAHRNMARCDHVTFSLFSALPIGISQLSFLHSHPSRFSIHPPSSWDMTSTCWPYKGTKWCYVNLKGRPGW